MSKTKRCERTVMTNRVVALLACASVTGVLRADPPTPPSHPEKDFRPIGGGLFVSHDETAEADSDGNTAIMVFSRTLIKAASPYTLDLSVLAGVPSNDLVYDAGTFGQLRAQTINIDCVHQTYEVIDARKMLPQPIWRPVSTLPALAPVFRFACRHQPNKANEAR